MEGQEEGRKEGGREGACKKRRGCGLRLLLGKWTEGASLSQAVPQARPLSRAEEAAEPPTAPGACGLFPPSLLHKRLESLRSCSSVCDLTAGQRTGSWEAGAFPERPGD